ncbi:hypothetical protein ACWT_8104 [Actinoplanes sp. SE50]|uniref:WXG100 family type VII secretion target n=1 Tax=unclassified Actinoplanes TaxID=2626549 RepID=UPI00023EDD06|nr:MULTISPECIES: hypothetical protein [unclassified Actinoplanes]AEV89113.1 hypothetical protein ACPL_8235 [Actinoplanes sp. SE50/110]ATO87519.1 hypothetical protein ACWT_8104 [Actinoplanes sp. SE50]SLM04937.1 hypothetical protein ACSP50_8249 [Actinoplanes sp. SE50/110]
MGDELHVEPAVLHSARQVCEDLGVAWRRDEHGVEPVTEDAAAGLPGWMTGRALGDFVWYWQDDVKKLTGYLETFGDALQRAALTYEHTDHASADLFDIRGR